MKLSQNQPGQMCFWEQGSFVPRLHTNTGRN